MNLKQAIASLEALRHWERLEDLSPRFGLPHVPEFELATFRKLYYPELKAALAAIEAAPASAERSAWRGRVRRILGDLQGALTDLHAALDLDPEYAPARAWLGECASETGPALAELDLAVELDPRCAQAFLFRGARRLQAGDRAGAMADFARLAELEKSALGRLLAGDHAEAARLAPECSAAYLLLARAAKKPAERARWLREAYNVSPVLGFITLQIHQTLEVESPRYVDKILRFCFEHPEQVGAYYQREATQTHYSHFPAEDYTFVEKLVARKDELAWAHAFFGRAACYTPAGVPEGERHLSRAIELAPHAGWYRAWRANARAIAGRTQDALQDFADAIRLQPFYHRCFVWRAGLLRKLGRLPEALADLDRALAMDPFYSLTYHERSLVRRGLGDWAGAVSDLDRAFFLDARYRWVFKTGRPPTDEEFARGLEQLDAAIAAHPSLPTLKVWRGQLKLQRRDVSGGFADLLEAIQQDPHCALAFAWYGWGLCEAGDAARGAANLRRAVELEPRLLVAHGWLADAEWRLGRRKEAQAILAAVLRDKPKTAWAWWQRARFRLEDGKARPAIADLKRALLLDGKYPEAYLTLADAQLRLGRLKEAAAAAQNCLDIAPNLGRAYLMRAAVAMRQRRHAQAIEDYRRVRQEFPYLFNAQETAQVDALLAAAGREAVPHG